MSVCVHIHFVDFVASLNWNVLLQRGANASRVGRGVIGPTYVYTVIHDLYTSMVGSLGSIPMVTTPKLYMHMKQASYPGHPMFGYEAT